MNAGLTIALLALVTGFVTGAVFNFLQVPIPAPPEIPGIMGIVGIYIGYKIVERLDIGINVLGTLGIQ